MHPAGHFFNVFYGHEIESEEKNENFKSIYISGLIYKPVPK
jgi:hypothetical protein